MTVRSCGGCTACCSVVPVREIGLSQYTRCPKLSEAWSAKGPGCSIYTSRPYSCRAWSCGWLTSPELPDELRPEKSGIVIDEMVDMIRAINNKTGKAHEMTAAQIWVLPGFEEAYADSELIRTVILMLIDLHDAVLWRMKGGMVRTFMRDPETGQIGMSPPTMASPDGEHSLGSTGERLWRAAQLTAARKK